MKISAIFAMLISAVSLAHAEEPPRPNIVVLLCDDLGYGDLESYGHPHIKTPRLNELAAAGVQFDCFYSAAPVCSPSRVGLLTGRNPNRAGVFDWIPQANPDQPVKNSRSFVHMREEEFTIAEMLRAAGYATCMSGKWHCNAMFNSDKQAQPDDHGFDYWFATQNNASPGHENPRNFVKNGKPVGEIDGYSCEIVVDEAISWLETHKASTPEKPFFIYIAYHEPHEPVVSPSDLVDFYKANGARSEDEAQYFANVENLDRSTGKMVDAIDRLGFTDNTLIIFTSDNGPETLNRYRNATRSFGISGPLRGMKLHTHEAGYRVPGIMRWPNGIGAGQRSNLTISALDFLPTFAELAGADIPEDLLLDGASAVSAFSGKPIARERPLLWVYYHSYTEKGNYVPSVTMRKGPYKVRAVISGVEAYNNLDETNIDRVHQGRLTDFEIFNLNDDPGEQNPLPRGDSTLPSQLEQAYNAALEDFYIWPAVPGN